jgi:transglutaminase-like putative cysteine protease
MRTRAVLPGLVFALAAGLVSTPWAAQPEGKVLREIWEAAFLEGGQVGHFHTLFRELPMAEGKVIEGSSELEFNLIRFGQNLQLAFTMANHETPEGKVLAIVVQQNLSKDQKLVRKAKVVGNQIHVQAEMNMKPLPEKKLPWNENAVGLYGEEQLFKNRKLEPGTKFDFFKFEPELDSMLTYHVEMRLWEDVALLRGVKKRLLRIETRTDKVENIELPPVTSWIDEKGDTFKRQVFIPGLGQVTTYRTTRELALARGAKAPVDIGISQMIRLNRDIPRPMEATEVVYRVTLKGVDEPLKAFASDDRQKIQNQSGDSFAIIVQGRQRPELVKPGEMPKEFLKSNHFLRSDDAKVIQLAEQAVGTERDPLRKALRIEQWVHKNLKNKNYSEAFATADQVARTLDGDCTEHAVLAAAMCRAVGVPARPAVGLVYVQVERAMCYHMWLEVWVNGQWIGLDPTLGLGRVAVGHIKIADHSWNDMQSFKPLYPVTRILGKVQIEVSQIQY